MPDDMVKFTVGSYTVSCRTQGLPADIYDRYREHAELAEEFDLQPRPDDNCFLAVQKDMEWPFLVIAHGYSRDFEQEQIGPCALLVPESDRLFVAVHRHLICFDLLGPARLWETEIDSCFWQWQHHEDIVLGAAELEMFAWDIYGAKRWQTFVEPPWSYRVAGDEVRLDVMGIPALFPLVDGPSWEPGKWPWVHTRP